MVENTITPLEDIEIQTYYGLACSSLESESFFYNYVDDNGNYINIAPSNSESKDKSCRTIIEYNDKNMIIVTMNDDGLGDMSKNDTNYSAFAREYGGRVSKAYFNLINHNDKWETLEKDTNYYFSGSYQFLKNN